MGLILEGSYDLREFARNISPDFDHHCGCCYSVHAEAAAAYAAEHGFDNLTSTLFISPCRNHEPLREIMEQSAERYGVELPYRDFRPYFREGQEEARKKGLYMQKYCGCVFSEEGRYRRKPKRRKEAVQAL